MHVIQTGMRGFNHVLRGNGRPGCEKNQETLNQFWYWVQLSGFTNGLKYINLAQDQEWWQRGFRPFAVQAIWWQRTGKGQTWSGELSWSDRLYLGDVAYKRPEPVLLNQVRFNPYRPIWDVIGSGLSSISYWTTGRGVVRSAFKYGCDRYTWRRSGFF